MRRTGHSTASTANTRKGGKADSSSSGTLPSFSYSVTSRYGTLDPDKPTPKLSTNLEEYLARMTNPKLADRYCCASGELGSCGYRDDQRDGAGGDGGDLPEEDADASSRGERGTKFKHGASDIESNVERKSMNEGENAAKAATGSVHDEQSSAGIRSHLVGLPMRIKSAA